jgi:CxxC motif-containing protein (DUF1111 family)
MSRFVCIFAGAALAAALASGQDFGPTSTSSVRDPGVRSGAPGAGGAVPGLNAAEAAAFVEFQTAFTEVDGTAEGLGPRFNLDSCAGCHIFPAIGGSSPKINPQIAMATKMGALNRIPPFLTQNGPIREVRFKLRPDGSRDGGVHGLFTVKGRSDAPGCTTEQENFSNTSNLSFRIPTPTFGLGLVESIPDSAIRANLAADGQRKSQLGISGQLNTNGNDGTVTRFGWKAQNKSLFIFSGEAYNVEQGITNEAFPNERDENASCQYGGTPEDHTSFVPEEMGDVVQFALFMKFLAAPTPAAATNSTENGRRLFGSIGCALCHTPTLTTGRSTTAALDRKPVNLFSDLALHGMGAGLADGISQGAAGPAEFRTAPLWGLGQRIFLLHDGRTSNLVEAIQEHASAGSEANQVIGAYSQLSSSQKQDLLNFLRSL